MIARDLRKRFIQINKVCLMCSSNKLKTGKTNFRATTQNKPNIRWQTKASIFDLVDLADLV